MNLSEITLVLGVDGKTCEQLAISVRTWSKHHPELWHMPWLVFYDPSQVGPEDFRGHNPDMRIVPWSTQDEQYASQRAAMLTGFVHVPPGMVRTPWWMKLDCDAIALDGKTPLVEDDWFGRDERGYYNVWIASPWGYTKAKGDNRGIAEWAEALESFGDKMMPSTMRRLDLAKHISSRKIFYPRMASWMSFYQTEWTARVSNAVGSYLPVPSQDTLHWYIAERGGSRNHRVRFKRRGWTNVPHIDKLARKVEESLA